MLNPGARVAMISRAFTSVRCVHVGVKETDRDALKPFRHEVPRQLLNSGLVERHQLAAGRRRALVHHEAVIAGNQGRGQYDIEVVLLEAVLGAHLDNVAKPERRQECGLRALPLDQCVRGQRGSMNDEIDVGHLDVSIPHHALHAIQDGLLGRRIGGQYFDGVKLTTHLHGHIGKRAPDVDPEPHLHSLMAHGAPTRKLRTSESTPVTRSPRSDPTATMVKPMSM